MAIQLLSDLFLLCLFSLLLLIDPQGGHGVALIRHQYPIRILYYTILTYLGTFQQEPPLSMVKDSVVPASTVVEPSKPNLRRDELNTKTAHFCPRGK